MWFRRKLCQNSLAQLAVLFASDKIHLPDWQFYFLLAQAICQWNMWSCIAEIAVYMISVIVKPLSTGAVYAQVMGFVLTVPADELAPDGAKSSACPVLTAKLMFLKFLWLLMVQKCSCSCTMAADLELGLAGNTVASESTPAGCCLVEMFYWGTLWQDRRGWGAAGRPGLCQESELVVGEEPCSAACLALPLKTVSCHDANFVITGGTGCHEDSLWCHQWW